MTLEKKGKTDAISFFKSPPKDKPDEYLNKSNEELCKLIPDS